MLKKKKRLKLKAFLGFFLIEDGGQMFITFLFITLAEKDKQLMKTLCLMHGRIIKRPWSNEDSFKPNH